MFAYVDIQRDIVVECEVSLWEVVTSEDSVLLEESIETSRLRLRFLAG